jgi:thioredoxin 1
MSYPDPDYYKNDPFRKYAMCVLFAIMLVAIFMFGCDQPQRDPPCCPKDRCEPQVRIYWFSATWCGPCKRQAPEAEAALQGWTWRKVDIDREPSLASKYKVGSVPTYIVIVDGVERYRTSDAGELRQRLRR